MGSLWLDRQSAGCAGFDGASKVHLPPPRCSSSPVVTHAGSCFHGVDVLLCSEPGFEGSTLTLERSELHGGKDAQWLVADASDGVPGQNNIAFRTLGYCQAWMGGFGPPGLECAFSGEAGKTVRKPCRRAVTSTSLRHLSE